MDELENINLENLETKFSNGLTPSKNPMYILELDNGI